MKRRLLFLLAIIFSLGVYAQEHEDLYHWSLDLRAGANDMRNYQPEDKRFYWNFTPGVSLEYTVNPLWGLGVNYTYLPFDEVYESKAPVEAFSHEAAVFGSVNLSNLLAKYRRGNWQKFSVYSNFGIGYCFYKFDNKATGSKGGSDCLLRFGELTAEYNITRLWAVGLGAQYRIHQTSNMRRDPRGLAYDFQDFYMAHLNLRYKFGGNRKDKRHVRNISYLDYERARTVSEESALLPVIADLNNKVKELQGEVDDLKGRLNGHIESTNRAIDDLERKALAQAQKEIVDRVFEAIRFDFDSYAIREIDIPPLNELAIFMKENPTWNLRLSGHTDSIGSEEYNQALSERRSAMAKKYLVNKGVSADRIIIDGFGETQPVAPNTTPEGRQLNRRVEVDVRK